MEKIFDFIFSKSQKTAIRACRCKNASDYWVVNGSSQEIRPVRVLFAEY
jgi:hypothetical protein